MSYFSLETSNLHKVQENQNQSCLDGELEIMQQNSASNFDGQAEDERLENALP